MLKISGDKVPAVEKKLPDAVYCMLRAHKAAGTVDGVAGGRLHAPPADVWEGGLGGQAPEIVAAHWHIGVAPPDHAALAVPQRWTQAGAAARLEVARPAVLHTEKNHMATILPTCTY